MSADLTAALFLAPPPRARTAGAAGTGRPAVLAEAPLQRQLARELASASGAQDGLLARTSFHGLLDAIEASGPPGSTVLLDEHVYPVGRWAAAAALTGATGRTPGSRGRVLTYRHLDADDARRRLAAAGDDGRPVVVVTDGVCGSCLRPAPLVALAGLARTWGSRGPDGPGRVVVDDTLAAGVLGRRAARTGWFGTGGGGTAAWLGAPVEDLVVVASLAKGYGVPVALLAGPAEVVGRARRGGSARTHASPPSGADLATLAALAAPAELERRRRRLESLVEATREGARRLGLTTPGMAFPVVHLLPVSRSATEVRAGLAASGVRVLVTVGGCTGRRAVTVCLRSDLIGSDVDLLLRALAREVRPARRDRRVVSTR